MLETLLFENKSIRSVWSEADEEQYFSIVDVVGVLTEQTTPRGATMYWGKLKQRLKSEGSQLLTDCQQLKLKASDGKLYKTDVGNIEQIFRIIQSIPSPKVEPFKLWLASVGKGRINEIIDPELSIDRALETYLRKGYPKEWINQRLQSIQVRKELTDEWQERGVSEGLEYAILTNEISRAWSGMQTGDYKKFKGLKKENLRDNMSTLELVLSMLAEATTTELAKVHDSQGFTENQNVTRRGGRVAGDARKSIEADTGKPVITKENAIDSNKLLTSTNENL